jgi:hypothetical protein
VMMSNRKVLCSCEERIKEKVNKVLFSLHVFTSGVVDFQLRFSSTSP